GDRAAELPHRGDPMTNVLDEAALVIAVREDDKGKKVAVTMALPSEPKTLLGQIGVMLRIRSAQDGQCPQCQATFSNLVRRDKNGVDHTGMTHDDNCPAVCD